MHAGQLDALRESRQLREGRGRPEIRHVAGRVLVTQYVEHPAHLDERGPACRLDDLERLPGLLGPHAGDVIGGGRLDHDEAQPVGHDVVQVAGDPEPLLGDRALHELRGCAFREPAALAYGPADGPGPGEHDDSHDDRTRVGSERPRAPGHDQGRGAEGAERGDDERGLAARAIADDGHEVERKRRPDEGVVRDTGDERHHGSRERDGEDRQGPEPSRGQGEAHREHDEQPGPGRHG